MAVFEALASADCARTPCRVSTTTSVARPSSETMRTRDEVLVGIASRVYFRRSLSFNEPINSSSLTESCTTICARLFVWASLAPSVFVD